jgi:hypothetical protein
MFRFLLLALFVAMTSAFMAPAISPTLQGARATTMPCSPSHGLLVARGLDHMHMHMPVIWGRALVAPLTSSPSLSLSLSRPAACALVPRAVPALSMNEAAAKQAWLARAADTGNWGPGTRDPSPRARGAGRLAVRSAAGSLAGRVVPTGTWSASSEPQMPEDAFCTKDRANYDNYLAQNGLLNKAGGGW